MVIIPQTGRLVRTRMPKSRLHIRQPNSTVMREILRTLRDDNGVALG
jgi:hypothetical protein